MTPETVTPSRSSILAAVREGAEDAGDLEFASFCRRLAAADDGEAETGETSTEWRFVNDLYNELYGKS